MNAAEPRKSIARSVGEFFGHIMRGVKTDPSRPERMEVSREVEEEDRGDVVLRRTVVEEVELKDADAAQPHGKSEESTG